MQSLRVRPWDAPRWHWIAAGLLAFGIREHQSAKSRLNWRYRLRQFTRCSDGVSRQCQEVVLAHRTVGRHRYCQTDCHLATMADLHRAGRYDRISDDVFAVTGQKPLSMQEFVRNNAATFTDSPKAA
jgi:hypothetical protein